MAFLTGYFWILIVVIFFLISAVKILAEYERGVIFRLGRALDHAKGPGMIILIPIVDRMVKVNLQLITYDVPSQDIITRDNVTMKVNAVVYFRVIDPVKAIIEVRDYMLPPSCWPRPRCAASVARWKWTTCFPNGRR